MDLNKLNLTDIQLKGAKRGIQASQAVGRAPIGQQEEAVAGVVVAELVMSHEEVVRRLDAIVARLMDIEARLVDLKPATRPKSTKKED